MQTTMYIVMFALGVVPDTDLRNSFTKCQQTSPYVCSFERNAIGGNYIDQSLIIDLLKDDRYKDSAKVYAIECDYTNTPILVYGSSSVTSAIKCDMVRKTLVEKTRTEEVILKKETKEVKYKVLE